MFITTKYKMFESKIPQSDIDFCNNILSRKEEIVEDFDIFIQHRSPFEESGSKFIDLFKILPGGLKSSFGVYDITTKQFVLFYEGDTALHRDDYIRIPSKDFFSGLEMVYYKTYLDV